MIFLKNVLLCMIVLLIIVLVMYYLYFVTLKNIPELPIYYYSNNINQW